MIFLLKWKNCEFIKVNFQVKKMSPDRPDLGREQELTQLNHKQAINRTAIFSPQPSQIKVVHWFYKMVKV